MIQPDRLQAITFAADERPILPLGFGRFFLGIPRPSAISSRPWTIALLIEASAAGRRLRSGSVAIAGGRFAPATGKRTS
jgi:hypothetical protein